MHVKHYLACLPPRRFYTADLDAERNRSYRSKSATIRAVPIIVRPELSSASQQRLRYALPGLEQPV